LWYFGISVFWIEITKSRNLYIPHKNLHVIKTFLLVTIFCQLTIISNGQTSYKDSVKRYVKNYVESHEVVKGDDKKQMHFYDVSEKYRVHAKFERKENGDWFQMPTSGKMKQVYRVYGVLKFRLNGKNLQLNLYQSQSLMQTAQYKNYLFLPFTDATTGKSTYESGRYLDLESSDIKNNEVILDFNKAYNPYCAYVTGVYNCPIPPKENNLAVAVEAGEKKYGKHH
jgi:uncharacterized protein (DUF1684 family)